MALYYRRVYPETEELDGTLPRFLNGVKLEDGTYLRTHKLKESNIYPIVPVKLYDAKKQIVDSEEWFFDAEKEIVTNPVYDFEKGLKHNWKNRLFVDGEVFRKIRLRVKTIDTLKNGVLEDKAADLQKMKVDFYMVDTNGILSLQGGYTEVYLNNITPEDKAQMEAYCSQDEGCVLEYYDELS